MQTLLPFYAFDHAELEKRNGEAEKTVETFTMIVKRGKVEIQVSPARGMQYRSIANSEVCSGTTTTRGTTGGRRGHGPTLRST
jgi:hypothetical protein